VAEEEQQAISAAAESSPMLSRSGEFLSSVFCFFVAQLKTSLRIPWVLARFMSMHRPGNTFLPSKSLQDVTKTLLIVLYCSRKHEFGRASKHNT
jgi:hypothetical protein